MEEGHTRNETAWTAYNGARDDLMSATIETLFSTLSVTLPKSKSDKDSGKKAQAFQTVSHKYQDVFELVATYVFITVCFRLPPVFAVLLTCIRAALHYSCSRSLACSRSLKRNAACLNTFGWPYADYPVSLSASLVWSESTSTRWRDS